MNCEPWIWEQPDWPNFTWDSGLIDKAITKIDYARGEITAIGKSLDKQLSRRAVLEILLNQAIASSAIEGESVNRENLRISLAKRLALPVEAGCPADSKTEGIADLMLQTNTAGLFPISHETLHGWHRALFPTGYSGMKKIAIGRYRDCPADITDSRETKVFYCAPSAKNLKREMDLFIAWFNDPPQDLHALVYSAIAHLWFVSIHPYEDGNGRISRALADLALTKFEKARLYATAPIMAKRNSGYYESLQKTNHTLEITPWILNYIQCVGQAIEHTQTVINHTLRIDRFWKKFGDRLANERQIKVVKKLLNAGRGEFAGGMSNKKYCAISRCSNKTAAEDLKALENAGILVRLPGEGRSTAFDIDWDALSSPDG